MLDYNASQHKIVTAMNKYTNKSPKTDYTHHMLRKQAFFK